MDSSTEDEPSASGASGGGGGGGQGCWWDWGSSLIKVAAEKSGSALQFVHKDLVEFSSTLTHDTSDVINHTTADLKNKFYSNVPQGAGEQVKSGLNSLWGGISKTISSAETILAQTAGIGYPIYPNSGPDPGDKVYDRFKLRLYEMQVDPSTYQFDPAENDSNTKDQRYSKWLEEEWSNPASDERKSDISDLLLSNSEIHSLYTVMVPSAVSHSDFWRRYFYQAFLLEQDESRRAEMMERAESTTNSLHEKIDWSDDEEALVSDQVQTDTQKHSKFKNTTLAESAKTDENMAAAMATGPITVAIAPVTVATGSVVVASGASSSSSSEISESFSVIDEPSESFEDLTIAMSQHSIRSSPTQTNPQKLPNHTTATPNQPITQVPGTPRDTAVADSQNRYSERGAETDATGAEKGRERGENSGATDGSYPRKQDRDITASVSTTAGDSDLVTEWDDEFDLGISDVDLQKAQEIIKNEGLDQILNDNWEGWE